MRRLWITAFLLVSFTASAKSPTDNYTAVTLKDLTEFSSHFPTIDLNDDIAYSEYLKVTSCDIYRSLKDNQFKLQEAKQALIKERQSAGKYDRDLYFYIPVTFLTSGYNFDTQALTIVQENQLDRVNNFQLFNDMSPVCGERLTLQKTPYNYRVKLNFPISLRRIPLQKTAAEAVINKLDPSASNTSAKIIYGNIYLQIDPVAPDLLRPPEKSFVSVHGQVNYINLYVDQDRKILFKQMNYSDAF